MALILAIESDHRQAAQLVQIVRHRLGAELILAETFEAALPAIGNRVPDLILVPALLSPEDDAALKFVLRAISHSSHVQVLTTPTFAGSHSKLSSRGILTGFLRQRTTSAVDGCDPEEFARHVASYLAAADEKRAQPPVIGPAEPEYEAGTPAIRQSIAPQPAELPVETVDEARRCDAPPVVVDKNALDRLASDLNRLFTAGAAGSEQESAKPLPESVEPPRDPNSTADEWGLFDPKQCGIEVVLAKLKEIPT